MGLHIGMLTSEYPYKGSVRSGGIGTSIKNLAIELARQQVEVTVFVHSQPKDDVFFEDNVRIHLVKSRRYGWFTFYRYRKFVQRYINNRIEKDKIDIIEAPDWTGITAFLKFSAPLVIRFHGSDAYFCKLENRKQKAKNFIFEWLAMYGADAFICPTTFAGTLTSQIFNIQKPVRTIHYGISLEDFNNPAPDQYEKGLILYVGTIIRKKGVFELPPIMELVSASYPSAKIVLIGADSADITSGSSSTWQLIKEKFGGSKVEYLGKVPYEEVQKYIQKAHVCVFPTFAETLGMVTIEAMAMQKAVVNSGFGWAQEVIVDNNSGFLVNPTNHDEFAKRILMLLTDDDIRRNIQNNARKRVVDNFDITKKVNDNIEFYQDLIKLRK